METHTPPKVRFLKNLPRTEPIIVDSTSMMTFKRCPRLYLYRIVLGFADKVVEPYFRFGSAYHKFREVLEIHHKAGASTNECLEHAKNAALELFKKEGGNPPLDSKWSFMNEPRLFKSFMVAWERWVKEKEQGVIKVIAVEQPFILEMKDGTLRAGRADQMVSWRGDLWGRDWKTTSKELIYYDRNLEPNEQFTGYTWAEGKLQGRECKGQIVDVLMNSKTKGPVVQTFTTTRSKEQLNWWEEDHAFWVQFMKYARENDHYPMQENSCTFCSFRRICSLTSESAMMSDLRMYYKFQPWDCTKVSQGSEE